MKCSCAASSGICGCITRGLGELSNGGFWSQPCPHGNAFEDYKGQMCEYHKLMRETLEKALPGARVIAFDHLLYMDDIRTPLSYTMRPATVVARYGQSAEHLRLSDVTLGPYPDLVDVLFDHRPERVSKGHFTDGVHLLYEEKK